MRRRLCGMAAALCLLLVTATISASAASPSPSPSASPSTGANPQHGPPSKVLGLDVQKEDITKTLAGNTDKRALYVDRVGLFSFREPSKLLEATLEIAHFRSNAPWSSSDFQSTIVGVLSASTPIVVRVEGIPVYVTTSKGLTIGVWFRSGFMMALSIRNTYTAPKELLRISLGINP